MDNRGHIRSNDTSITRGGVMEYLLLFSIWINAVLCIKWLFAVKREKISDSALRIVHEMLKEKTNEN